MTIEIGSIGRAETVVTEQNTAAAVGSGLVSVFATPCMVALMERAAVNAVGPFLEPGQSTVGTRIEVSHDSPTPIGSKVYGQAEVIKVDGKRIVFSVAAYDEAGPIGAGTHERFIIQAERFMAKAEQKKH